MNDSFAAAVQRQLDERRAAGRPLVVCLRALDFEVLDYGLDWIRAKSPGSNSETMIRVSMARELIIRK